MHAEYILLVLAIGVQINAMVISDLDLLQDTDMGSAAATTGTTDSGIVAAENYVLSTQYITYTSYLLEAAEVSSTDAVSSTFQPENVITTLTTSAYSSSLYAATELTSTSSELTSTSSESTSTTSTSSTSISASTTSASSSSSAATTDQFAESILAQHNAKRALHEDTSPLVWSADLESVAQAYADSYDCSGTLVHSGKPYGENLALGYPLYAGTTAVDAWYNEISYYDYSNPGFSEDTGHFTQVVWKDTSEVGCGYKQCNNEWGFYLVCNYLAQGNVIGEFGSEVEPLK